MTLNNSDRIRGALFGLFVADATAMPVHWMYNLSQLKQDYGIIKGYVKPKDSFYGSIMNLSNTGGGGRGSFEGSIIGDVINHDKKKYWVRGGNYHYHLGLQAGENTLEAQLTRLLIKCMSFHDHLDLDDFRGKYVKFMTTKGSHNDTYASTCHRQFFANYANGVNPKKCPDNDGHNTDAIDCLTLAIPVILHYCKATKEERDKAVLAIIHCTRKVKTITEMHAIAFSDLLIDILENKNDLKTCLEECGKRVGIKSVRKMVENSFGEDPMAACYIDSAFETLLHFAYKYSDSPEKAILANANSGGENVARGSCLGAIMGAAHGMKFPTWSFDLYDNDAINSELDIFISHFESLNK
jgi:ADP-ribosyl-[dinitrogen reductase] hydrolase